jgi:hypothetical protein
MISKYFHAGTYFGIELDGGDLVDRRHCENVNECLKTAMEPLPKYWLSVKTRC